MVIFQPVITPTVKQNIIDFDSFIVSDENAFVVSAAKN